MERRIHGTEKKQRQMMVFLANAVKNPALVEQLMIRSEQNQQLLDIAGKKRRLLMSPIFENQQESSGIGGELEIENMISEMVDSGDSIWAREQQAEEGETLESGDQNAEATWEELLHESLLAQSGVQRRGEEEIGVAVEDLDGDAFGWGDDDVDNLVDQMGFLGSDEL